MNTAVAEHVELSLVEREQASLAEVPAIAGPVGIALQAMKAGMSIADLRDILSLQRDHEANEARKAYNAAFAAFKSEAVTILKNRQVTDGPLKNKKYAELYAVVNAATPALSRHGLSASWRLTKDDKDWIEVTCTLKHSGGHFESVSMGGPPDAGGAKNAIQARASTVTYLERYTLKAITGLSEQDDDKDGNGVPGADWVAAAESAATEDDLRRITAEGTEALTKAKSVEGYRNFMRAVQKRRAALKGGHRA